MSTTTPIAQRLSRPVRLACSAALVLAAGAAAAQTADMGRVEIHGRVIDAPVRYDVHAQCANLESQLERPLSVAWFNEQRYGSVLVQFLMEGGEIKATQAQGLSWGTQLAVRRAVNRLNCGPQRVASAQLYRFRIDFVDPDAPADTRTADDGVPVIRVASLSR